MATDKSVSFYFFDFDDNTMFLGTFIRVKNAKTGELKELSTTEFAEIGGKLGEAGDWRDFGFFEGTYRYFRDIPADELQPGQKQWFVQDIGVTVASLDGCTVELTPPPSAEPVDAVAELGLPLPSNAELRERSPDGGRSWCRSAWRWSCGASIRSSRSAWSCGGRPVPLSSGYWLPLSQ